MRVSMPNVEQYTAHRFIEVYEGETKRIDLSTGTIYIKDGKIHNTDGPAIVRDGVSLFYIEGCEMSLKEWLTYCTLSDTDKAAMLFTME